MIWLVLNIIEFILAIYIKDLLKFLDFTSSLFYISFGMIIPTFTYSYFVFKKSTKFFKFILIIHNIFNIIIFILCTSNAIRNLIKD